MLLACYRLSSDADNSNSFLSSKSSIVCHFPDCHLHKNVCMPNYKKKIYSDAIAKYTILSVTFAHVTSCRKSILYGPGRIRSPNTT